MADKKCRVSVDELENDLSTHYWEYGERELEIIRLITDPWELKKFLELDWEMLVAISIFCLNESCQLDTCSRSLMKEIEKQANKYLDK